MNRHPEIGAEILGRSRIPLFQLAAEVALSHHERWDGARLPAAAWPARPSRCPGRIVAVVDFFDALTMDRCYRPAFSDERAARRCCAPSAAVPSTRAWSTPSSTTLAEMIALRDSVNPQPARLRRPDRRLRRCASCLRTALLRTPS